MVIIANPIYDSVFKYMLEDERVARILLSALMKKEVLELKTQRHEYTNAQQTRISLFRIDFSAKVRDADGKENLVLIELQKTWLATETLRFRQYLGAQYAEEQNMQSGDNKKKFGLPIISIYILGHKVGDIKNPVIYVRRSYFDYDGSEITEGVPDPFIESLTHDSIIVQIPYLKDKARNRLERILSIFDQKSRLKDDVHLLTVDDESMDSEERMIVKRLTMAVASPDVRRSMKVEDEFLSEIEDRDTEIMMGKEEIRKRDEVIEQNRHEIEQNRHEIEQNRQEIEQNRQEIEQNRQEIEQKERILKTTVKNLLAKGMDTDEISAILSISRAKVEELLK